MLQSRWLQSFLSLKVMSHNVSYWTVFISNVVKLKLWSCFAKFFFVNQTYKFEIEMTCEGCANAVKRVLSQLGDSISYVNTDISSNTVTVTTALSEKEVLDQIRKTSKPVKAIH